MKGKLFAIAGALLIAWALKDHYAEARADDLLWILTPTTRIVGVVTGADFTLQSGEGYFSRDRMFLIEKSCAGINFMIAAFVILVFALLSRVRSVGRGAAVLSLSLTTGYAAAVVVNAVRIAVAMWLAAHPGAIRSISAADLHRLEGIVVYFGGLVLLSEAVQRLDRSATIGRRS